MVLRVCRQVTDLSAMAEKAHETAHELKDSYRPAIDSLEARMVRLEASAYPLSQEQRSKATKDNAGDSAPDGPNTSAPASSPRKEPNVFANWTPAQEHLVQVIQLRLLCAQLSLE